MCCRIRFVSVLSRISTSVFIRDTDLWFPCVVSDARISVMRTSQNVNVSSSSIFWKCLRRICVNLQQFGKNPPAKSCIVPDFLLVGFWLLNQFLYLERSVKNFYFFLESVLVICMFLGICPFYLGYLICLQTIAHSTLL